MDDELPDLEEEEDFLKTREVSSIKVSLSPSLLCVCVCVCVCVCDSEEGQDLLKTRPIVCSFFFFGRADGHRIKSNEP